MRDHVLLTNAFKSDRLRVQIDYGDMERESVETISDIQIFEWMVAILCIHKYCIVWQYSRRIYIRRDAKTTKSANNTNDWLYSCCLIIPSNIGAQCEIRVVGNGNVPRRYSPQKKNTTTVILIGVCNILTLGQGIGGKSSVYILRIQQTIFRSNHLIAIEHFALLLLIPT